MHRLHTYYDNLKVPRTASPETIRTVYRRLSQKHHPDRNSGDPEAARIMVLINIAAQLIEQFVAELSVPWQAAPDTPNTEYSCFTPYYKYNLSTWH